MGGSISNSNAQIFASKVVAFEYERIKSRLIEEEHLDEYLHLPKLSDELLCVRLQSIYQQALIEADLPFAECRNVCVFACKYNKEASLKEKSDFLRNVVLATIDREQSNYKPMTNSDYSKSFSGSAADTKAENEAAALMKASGGGEGEDVTSEIESNLFLRRPLITENPRSAVSDAEKVAAAAFQSHDKHILMNLCGVYLKFLGPSDCFLYVHSASKEVVSLRPSEYDEELDLGGGQALANERLAALSSTEGGTAKSRLFDAPISEEEGIPEGMRTCTLQEMPNAIDDIISNENKTPLLLDTTEDQKVRVFMQYKHRLQDVSALTIPFAKSGLKRTDVMEQCRKTLVGALKSGTTMALYLGGCTIEHADFKKKLCKKDTFPVDVFQKAGQRLVSKAPSGEPRYAAVYREGDLEAGQAVAREEAFRFVVVSALHPREYEEKLQECIPLGYLCPLYVRG